MKKTIIPILILLVCVGIYYRQVLPTGNDSNAYCQMASSVAYGRTVPGVPVWPVLYGAIGAPFVRIGITPQMTLSVISLLSAIGILLLLRKHLFAAILLALCPVFWIYSFVAMSEMFFTLILISIVFLLIKPPSIKNSLIIALLSLVAFETRYVGIVALGIIAGYALVNWIRERKTGDLKINILTLILATGFTGGGIIFNRIWWGTLAGHRPPGLTSIFVLIRQLGVALGTMWTGDHWPATTTIAAVIGVLALTVIVVKGLLSDDPLQRAAGITIAGYSAVIVLTHIMTDLTPIDRRYMMPVLPFVFIIFAQWPDKRLIAAAIVGSIALAIPNLLTTRSWENQPRLNEAKQMLSGVNRDVVFVTDDYARMVGDTFVNPIFNTGATRMEMPAANYCMISIPHYIDRQGVNTAPDPDWEQTIRRKVSEAGLQLRENNGTVIACTK